MIFYFIEMHHSSPTSVRSYHVIGLAGPDRDTARDTLANRPNKCGWTVFSSCGDWEHGKSLSRLYIELDRADNPSVRVSNQIDCIL